MSHYEIVSDTRSIELEEAFSVMKIPTGERENVIVGTVLSRAKQKQKSIAEDIGIGTSLSEEDIKNYVEEVESLVEEVEKEQVQLW